MQPRVKRPPHGITPAAVCNAYAWLPATKTTSAEGDSGIVGCYFFAVLLPLVATDYFALYHIWNNSAILSTMMYYMFYDYMHELVLDHISTTMHYCWFCSWMRPEIQY